MSLLAIRDSINDFLSGTSETCRCCQPRQPVLFLYHCTEGHTESMCLSSAQRRRGESLCECGSGACPGGYITCVLSLDGMECDIEGLETSHPMREELNHWIQTYIKQHHKPNGTWSIDTEGRILSSPKKHERINCHWFNQVFEEHVPKRRRRKRNEEEEEPKNWCHFDSLEEADAAHTWMRQILRFGELTQTLEAANVWRIQCLLQMAVVVEKLHEWIRLLDKHEHWDWFVEDDLSDIQDALPAGVKVILDDNGFVIRASMPISAEGIVLTSLLQRFRNLHRIRSDLLS